MQTLAKWLILLLVAATVRAAEPQAPAPAPGAGDASQAAPVPRWALRVQLPDKSVVTVDSAEHPIPAEGPLADLAVRVVSDAAGRHRMTVSNRGQAVALREITFPILDMPVTDADTVVVPAVSGRLHRRPASVRLDFKGEYPGGWLPMQCAGYFGPKGGVYVGVHDPYGSTKRLAMETRDGRLRIAWTWPAPNCGVAGGAWKQPGKVLVRRFDGDWFDLAMLYRDWASEGAEWWPRDAQAGRPDTPAWMKDMAVWALASGEAKTVVPAVTKFARYLGVPAAVHWYNWHVIPFDNDYPHYFPAKDGFAEGVKDLQAAGVRVMPYINGRLWDTDLEDFKADAFNSATRDESGQPYIEEYGSGQKLAPMCPTTPLWQKTVRDIVMRLTGPEFNVDGVYIDQVAAASPRLCFGGPTHCHPRGGGCWWTLGGYWPLLTDLREAMAAERPGKMITTECNAEPFVHLFDGYLTWHFQENDAVPLFTAVYGGQVQMFSRAYQGDSWKGPAMRQKTAQALTWGEQLGWIGPEVVDDPVAGPFLKRLARLRYDLRAYFTQGRLARPPRVADDGATVTADWRWGGSRVVTTPAVLSGAWQAAGGVVLLFVNVDEKTHAIDLDFDGAVYGLSGALAVSERTGLEASDAAPPAAQPAERTWRRRITLEPAAALALEVRAATP